MAYKESREDIIRARNEDENPILFDEDEEKVGNGESLIFDDEDDDFLVGKNNINRNSAVEENNSTAAKGSNVSGIYIAKEGDEAERISDTILGNLINVFKLLASVIQSFTKNTVDDTINSFRATSIATGIVTTLFLLLYFYGYSINSDKMMRVGVNFSYASLFNSLLGIFVVCAAILISYKTMSIEDIKAALIKEAEKLEDEDDEKVNEIKELETEYSRSMEDIMKEVLDDDDFDDEEDDNTNDDEDGDDDYIDDTEENDNNINKRSISFDDEEEERELVDDIEVNAAGIITREILFDTFSKVLPQNAPSYSKIKKIDEENEKFQNIETIIVKAFANICGLSVDDFVRTYKEAQMDKLTDSLTSIHIKFPRLKKKNISLEKLNEELLNYNDDIIDLMCDKKQLYTGNDTKLNKIAVDVKIKGDDYLITITKPNNQAILLGDVIRKEEVQEYLLDKRNKFPVITGLSSQGQPVYADIKDNQSIFMAGKARSGKSWESMNILFQLCAFNSPEDFQMFVIDPKNTDLFQKISLLPHCAGAIIGNANTKFALHALEALQDILDKEVNYRTKVIKDNECNNIWDLRGKGVKMPLLLVYIDEALALKAALEKADTKEKKYSKIFDNIMNTFISYLPSMGIYFMTVAHRLQGVISKTARELVAMKIAARADETLIGEIFDKKELKEFNRPLLQPGDLAYKANGDQYTKYVKGLGIETKDEKVTPIITLLAKSFYKMNCEIPDMTSMGIGCNRDEDKVKQILFEGKKWDDVMQNEDEDGNEDTDNMDYVDDIINDEANDENEDDTENEENEENEGKEEIKKKRGRKKKSEIEEEKENENEETSDNEEENGTDDENEDIEIDENDNEENIDENENTEDEKEIETEEEQEEHDDENDEDGEDNENSEDDENGNEEGTKRTITFDDDEDSEDDDELV